MTDGTTRDDTDQQGRLANGISSAREAANRALGTVGDSAGAARRSFEGLEGNPLGLIVGGLAVGAVAGALLPRSDREKQLLAPVGSQLSERARAAIGAAREAGKGRLDELGISREAARDQLKTLFEGLGQALSTAGSAAARSAAAKPGANNPG